MNNADERTETAESWQTLRTWAVRILEAAGNSNSMREATWLAEHAADISPGMFLHYAETLPEIQTELLFRENVQMRATRYPLQYIIGSVPFLNVKIRVTEDVLIPRHETEQLAALVLAKAHIYDMHDIRCLDLGTGSGCLAVALAKELPGSQWDAVEISESALDVARANARENAVESRITFYHGSWWAPLPDAVKYDIIVTNPPYIADDTLVEKELFYEPENALYAGADGGDAYRAILHKLSCFLKPTGFFLGEISPELTPLLFNLIRTMSMTASCVKDAAEKTRFLCLTQ
jgi:release factor glutamine methyltransferase